MVVEKVVAVVAAGKAAAGVMQEAAVKAAAEAKAVEMAATFQARQAKYPVVVAATILLLNKRA